MDNPSTGHSAHIFRRGGHAFEIVDEAVCIGAHPRTRANQLLETSAQI